MTGTALEAIVRHEVRRARLRFQVDIRRGPTGLYAMLFSDWSWQVGIGGRRIFGHDDIRRRESNVGILALHSTCPTITFGGEIAGADPLQTLYPPPKCDSIVLAALVSHAIAQTVPTPWRLREARRRLRAAGVRLSAYREKPPFTRRTA